MFKLYPHPITKHKLKIFLWPSSVVSCGQRPLQLPSVHCYCAVLDKPHTHSHWAPNASDAQSASAKTMQGSEINCPWHLCLCVTHHSQLSKNAEFSCCILHTESVMDLQHHKIINMANKTWLVNSIVLLIKSNTILHSI